MLRTAGTALFATVLACTMLPMSGCHSPAGGMFPNPSGTMTYVSTETRQMTISVVDVRTDEEVFVMHVPPGKQLTMDFRRDGGDDPVVTPDLMRWELFDAGRRTGRLHNALTVPNAASRRIDVFVNQGIKWQAAPPEQRLRTDELAERPDWWTPQGGKLPQHSPAEIYDG